MFRPKQQIILLLTFIICSCTNNNTYRYAIKDSPKKLQPHLTKMVEKGIVMHSDSALKSLTTDKELERLGKSEHPIIRASAFREMLKRKSINHFEIIMGHLDDTALVFTDAGEFGIWDRTVTDDILQEAVWKTQELKDKTVEQVLTKHNYLTSAYTILKTLQPQEKYYPFIKDMATRPRRLDPDEEFELGFSDIEYALYGLAMFQKKEDVVFIKNKLLRYVGRLSDISFQLMTEFPDTAYMDVLQAYHRRRFYKFSGNRPHGFSGVVADRAAPEDFIQALVVQESDRSSKLLDTMLNRLASQTCMPDQKNIIDRVVIEIWENPCPAYEGLRKKIQSKAEEILKWQIIIPIDTIPMPVDTTESTIRW
ncbi:hypothetical protein [Flavihumibacter solisilvae]|uniref:Lipoprotein n=1 Tax=Flavihumibacter solisilvae TaxID=1349421 RepID=A0A0C1IP33_9BACT|nr:hypothetical protein [Flavihumibacter solisilvae]KIC95965.1 hypothetical protein OI18_03545 [Flavihumibacter solisilvae]